MIFTFTQTSLRFIFTNVFSWHAAHIFVDTHAHTSGMLLAANTFTFKRNTTSLKEIIGIYSLQMRSGYQGDKAYTGCCCLSSNVQHRNDIRLPNCVSKVHVCYHRAVKAHNKNYQCRPVSSRLRRHFLSLVLHPPATSRLALALFLYQKF